MAQIRFYRGAAGVSLPEYQNGAIFVVSNSDFFDGYYLGDIYVDIDNGKRLKIQPNNAIYYKTQAQWAESNEISMAGKIYVVSDYQGCKWADDDTEKQHPLAYLPGIRVGDGTSFIRDLPIYQAFVTSEEKNFWNKKVTAFTTTNIIEKNSMTNQKQSGDYRLCLSALGTYTDQIDPHFNSN